jgi:hypothetical protein
VHEARPGAHGSHPVRGRPSAAPISGLIIVSWMLCDCPAARAASGGGAAGHMAVFCNAAPGCRSVWYRPRHEPGPRAG